jgi:hypothetical protein
MCGSAGQRDNDDDPCGDDRRRIEQATDRFCARYPLARRLTSTWTHGGQLGSPAALFLIALLSGT